jgi:formate/nitrite transporter
MFVFHAIFGTGYADGCDGVPTVVKNRRAETHQSDDILFIVDGVSSFPCFPENSFKSVFVHNGMLRNWIIVYAGNLIGSLFIAYMMMNSGLFSSGAGVLGAVTVKIAANKVNLAFLQAFYLGIMCNWLVCLAVWLSYGAESMAGKILGIFFPIWLFITSGFEHSVANMYYIPAGIMARSNPVFSELAGLSQEMLDKLTWSGFFINNLIPVTLGNIVGGGLFVGMAYWYSYKKA